MKRQARCHLFLANNEEREVSFQATKWAKRQRASGNLKLLLMVLADYAKKETGKSWHPQATLADDVGVSTRTVRRLLVQLREMGLIHTEPMKREWDGGNGNLMITLLMDVPDTPEISIIPEASAAQAEAAPLNVARPHPADTGVRTPRTLLAAQEPSIEPSIEPESNIPRAARAAEPSDRERCPRTYRQSPAEAACAWNEIRRLDGWQTVWGEDEMLHWHALLRKGYAADDVVDFAWKFLRQTPAHE
jgi:DNA-binding Lrp family transcriptional regulator